jgi:hypothetical protein
MHATMRHGPSLEQAVCDISARGRRAAASSVRPEPGIGEAQIDPLLAIPKCQVCSPSLRHPALLNDLAGASYDVRSCLGAVFEVVPPAVDDDNSGVRRSKATSTGQPK